MLAKSAKLGKICTQWSQFPRDFWQTEYTESMKNMFLILYPVMRSLEAKGGSWGVMEMSPNVGKSPDGGSVCPPQSQNWKDFWQTEYAESMENMFWMLYPVLGSLGAKGGPWGAEMEGIFSPMWEKSPRWERFAPNGVNSQGISGK
jgi:hypothetical protein